MRCPYCRQDDDRVIDSRSAGDGTAIRRRRECRSCSKRFTTYEQVEQPVFRVVKKGGERAPYERKKVITGLLKACEKRAVPTEEVEGIVQRLEAAMEREFTREVPSSFIGEFVINELREVDQVAYVRFASVYRDFQDVTEFLEELRRIMGKELKEVAVEASGGPED